jgi:hypothetical protein
MSNAFEVQMTDSACFPRPLAEVIALTSGPDEPTRAGELMLTSGETHWSVDARVRLRLADPVRQEAKRRRLIELLSRPGPLWDPANHPESEAEGGSTAWVRRLRRESEEAFQRRTRERDSE